MTTNLTSLFSKALRSRRYHPGEDVVSGMEAFMEVKSKAGITEAHTQLRQYIQDFIENEEPPDDWELWESVRSFLQHYEQLTDTRAIDEKVREAIEARAGWGHDYTSEMMCYYPEEYGRFVPPKGAWIMVLKEIPVVEDYRPGLYNAYYAKPAPLVNNITVGMGKGEKTVPVKRHRVKIAVEAGEVMLWPYEYSVIKDPHDILQGAGTDKEYEMVRLGGTANYDEAKVHYLGTRGVTEADVYAMLLGDISSINYCYFRLKPEYFEQYDFLVSAMLKGITYEMACRLWYCKQTGKPLFNVKIVNDATSKPKPGKGRKKTNPS